MVCKDELCASFKSLRSADRIELLCGMLQLCIPLELRFIGSCLEELARKDYVELSEFETKANDCSCLQEVATSTCKKGLIHAGVLNIYLSLLHSDNTACARSLFSVLNELKNSIELQLDQEDDSLTDLLADSNFMDDVILLFTMASYHPAFTFCQRLQLYKSCKSIKESLKEAFKRIPSYDICPPVDANAAIVPDGESPDFLSQPYVKEVSLSSYKINTTERIHEYQIKISWCDGTTTELWKTYQELRSFHSSLLRLFPDDAGAHRQERNIPFLPQEQPSRTEQEMVELIKDYFKKVSTMPKNILRCEPMTEFLRDHSTSESVDESSVVSINGQSHDIPCKVIKAFNESTTSSGPGSNSHSTAELQNLELVGASDPVDLPVMSPAPLSSPDPQEQPPIHLPPMPCSLPQTVPSQFLPFPCGVNNSKALQPQFDMRVVNNCNDDIKQRSANMDQKLPISCNGLIPGDYTAAMNSQESFVYPFYNGMRMPMIDPFLYPFMFPNKNMAVDSFTPSFTNNESNPESDVLENDAIKNAEALKPQSEISSHTLMTFLPPDNMHVCSPNCSHLGSGDSRHCGSPATTDTNLSTFLRLSTVATTVGAVSSAPVAVQTTTTPIRTARPILGAFSNQSSNSAAAQNHDDATRRRSILGSEAHQSSGTAARSDQNVSTGSTISRSLSLGAIAATSIPTSTNLPSLAAAAPHQVPSFPTYHPNFPVDQQFGVPVPAPGFNLPFDHNFFQNSAVFGSAGITPTLPMQPLPANTVCACGVCPNCSPQGLPVHPVNMPSMPPYPYGYPNVLCFPQMYYPSNDLNASRFPSPNLLPGGMLSPPYMYGLMNNVAFQPPAGAAQPPTPANMPQSAQVLQSPVQNLKTTSKVYCHNCGAFGHDADTCTEPIMMPVGQAAQFKLKPMPVSKPE